MPSIPVINIAALIEDTDQKLAAAKDIGDACRDYGFFYVVNHGVDEDLQNRIDALTRRFFALPLHVKNKIRIELGGKSLRGYFPCEGELTSGKPDIKEGIYFGEELDLSHPLVESETPFYGPNLFPDEEIPEYRETVLEYLANLNNLSQKIMEGIALSLGLEGNFFKKSYTKEPLQQLGIFNYLPLTRILGENEVVWGVGEHTDYGLLTILKQDDAGGLEIKSKSEWIEAPPIQNSFICNIGDMLDRMTGGIYKSTPHR